MDILLQKVHGLIFLRQMKHITHDEFSICLLNTKSFYYGQKLGFVCQISGTFISTKKLQWNLI